MIWDNYGLLRTEHDATTEGAVGDSCAETFRFFILNYFLNKSEGSVNVSKALDNTFDTTLGYYIRHPLCDRSWGFGPDQWVPRYVFCRLMMIQERKRMVELCHLFDTNIFVLCAVRGWKIILWLQSWIFKYSKNTSNYLNWFMLMILFNGIDDKWYARAIKNIDPKVLMEKIESYYEEETNPGFSVPSLPLYYQAVKRIWGYGNDEFN